MILSKKGNQKMRMDQETRMCEYCNKHLAVTQHEIFYGSANRKISKKIDEFNLFICSKCHDAAHYKLDLGHDVNMALRIEAQMTFERRKSHEEFMELIKRNYLEMDNYNYETNQWIEEGA
jgi:hypothetical protein